MSDPQPPLPQGWVWATIGDILKTLESGGRPKGGVKGIDSGIPSIGGEHLLYNGGFDLSNLRYIPVSYYQKMNRGKILKKDVLVVKDGATTGKTSYVSENFPYTEAAVNEHVFILRVFHDYFSSKYLFYWLMSPFGQSCIKENFQGTAQGGINSTFIENSNLQVASFSEQHCIVTKIEELFTQLDAGVVSLKKVQAQLKRYRQAVLKAAFEGRLTQEWREEHKGEIEPAEVLIQKIKKKYPGDEKEISKRLPLDESELFQLPEEWIWVNAQDVCENITNGYTPTAEKLFEGAGEIPFIKVYNLTKNGALDFTIKPTFISRETHDTELKRSAVYPKDILMNIVGPPFGKVSLVPDLFPEWNINQAIVIYRTFPGYKRELFLYALLSETIQRWLQRRGKATAGQYNYTITMSRSLPVPLPSLKEQSVIVEEIERHFSQIDHLEHTISTSLRQAETLRQSILKRAFEGKLVPQDPNDEPASILLERIRAEKVHHTPEGKKGKTLQPKSPKRKVRNAN